MNTHHVYIASILIALSAPLAAVPQVQAAATIQDKQTLMNNLNDLNASIEQEHAQELAAAQETMRLIAELEKISPAARYKEIKAAANELMQYRTMLTQPKNLLANSDEIMSAIKTASSKVAAFGKSMPESLRIAKKLMANIADRAVLAKSVKTMETQRLMTGIRILQMEIESLAVKFNTVYKDPIIAQIQNLRSEIVKFGDAPRKRDKINIILDPVLSSVIAEMTTIQPLLIDIAPLIKDLVPHLIAPVQSSARIMKEELEEASIQKAYEVLAQQFDMQKLYAKIHITPTQAANIYGKLDTALNKTTIILPKIADNIVLFSQDKIPFINAKLRMVQSQWSIFYGAMNTLYGIVDPARAIISKAPDFLVGDLKQALASVAD